MFLHTNTSLLLTQFLSLVLLCIAAWHLKGLQAWLLAILLIIVQTLMQLSHLQAIESVYLQNAFLWSPGLASAFLFTFFLQKREETLQKLISLESRLRTAALDQDDLREKTNQLQQENQWLLQFGQLPEQFLENLALGIVDCHLKDNVPDWHNISRLACQILKAQGCLLYLSDSQTLKLMGSFQSEELQVQPVPIELDSNQIWIQKMLLLAKPSLNSETNLPVEFILGRALWDTNNQLLGLILIQNISFLDLKEKQLVSLDIFALILEAVLYSRITAVPAPEV